MLATIIVTALVIFFVWRFVKKERNKDEGLMGGNPITTEENSHSSVKGLTSSASVLSLEADQSHLEEGGFNGSNPNLVQGQGMNVYKKTVSPYPQPQNTTRVKAPGSTANVSYSGEKVYIRANEAAKGAIVTNATRQQNLKVQNLNNRSFNQEDFKQQFRASNASVNAQGQVQGHSHSANQSLGNNPNGQFANSQGANAFAGVNANASYSANPLNANYSAQVKNGHRPFTQGNSQATNQRNSQGNSQGASQANYQKAGQGRPSVNSNLNSNPNLNPNLGSRREASQQSISSRQDSQSNLSSQGHHSSSQAASRSPATSTFARSPASNSISTPSVVSKNSQVARDIGSQPQASASHQASANSSTHRSANYYANQNNREEESFFNLDSDVKTSNRGNNATIREERGEERGEGRRENPQTGFNPYEKDLVSFSNQKETVNGSPKTFGTIAPKSPLPIGSSFAVVAKELNASIEMDYKKSKPSLAQDKENSPTPQVGEEEFLRQQTFGHQQTHPSDRIDDVLEKIQAEKEAKKQRNAENRVLSLEEERELALEAHKARQAREEAKRVQEAEHAGKDNRAAEFDKSTHASATLGKGSVKSSAIIPDVNDLPDEDIPLIDTDSSKIVTEFGLVGIDPSKSVSVMIKQLASQKANYEKKLQALSNGLGQSSNLKFVQNYHHDLKRALSYLELYQETHGDIVPQPEVVKDKNLGSPASSLFNAHKPSPQTLEAMREQFQPPKASSQKASGFAFKGYDNKAEAKQANKAEANSRTEGKAGTNAEPSKTASRSLFTKNSKTEAIKGSGEGSRDSVNASPKATSTSTSASTATSTGSIATSLNQATSSAILANSTSNSRKLAQGLKTQAGQPLERGKNPFDGKAPSLERSSSLKGKVEEGTSSTLSRKEGVGRVERTERAEATPSLKANVRNNANTNASTTLKAEPANVTTRSRTQASSKVNSKAKLNFEEVDEEALASAFTQASLEQQRVQQKPQVTVKSYFEEAKASILAPKLNYLQQRYDTLENNLRIASKVSRQLLFKYDEPCYAIIFANPRPIEFYKVTELIHLLGFLPSTKRLCYYSASGNSHEPLVDFYTCYGEFTERATSLGQERGCPYVIAFLRASYLEDPLVVKDTQDLLSRMQNILKTKLYCQGEELAPILLQSDNSPEFKSFLDWCYS